MLVKDIIEFTERNNLNLKLNYSLKKLNWFNIGGKSRLFFKPESLKDLSSFLKVYNKRGKICVLGAGSNVLISDKTFEGVIIKLGNRFKNISKLENDKLIAGSAVTDKLLSEYAKENQLEGLEFLSCIPGTVGGGIKMNAGCYGREFKDILISVQAIDFLGNILTIPKNHINFSYRKTNLPNNLIFLSATFIGKLSSKTKIIKKIDSLKTKKDETQPSRIKTSGSTFKNPIEQTDQKVWQLIKKSVSPDLSFGDASISEHHSNFFVNKGNASFEEMMKLISHVKLNVKKKFKVDIDLEIVVIK